MENIKKSVWVVSAVLLVFSVVFFLSAQNFSKQGTFVEVKGLSEKIVKADVAIWSLNFEVKSNNIDSLYAEIARNTSVINSFLLTKRLWNNWEDLTEMNSCIDIYQNITSEANIQNYTSRFTLRK